MAGIFISYRRDDAQGEALHLFDNLKGHFGVDRVFMDVIAIRPGEDYRKIIDSAVASCDVLITLIGREWLQSTNAAGQSRLNDARDFVRLETAAALKRDVRVIPVLVQGAAMPTEEALPDELKPLAYRNAIELSHSRWDYDVGMLVEALERLMTPATPPPAPPPPTPGPPAARRPIPRMVAAGAVVALLIGGGGYWFWSRSVAPPTKPVAVTPDAPVPGTCIRGYVWREAFHGDRACVTPETRAEAAADNTQAPLRLERNPGKRHSGPDTCAQGYVWREASPTDHVCVTPETRAKTAKDNRQAASRIAR